VEFPQTTNETPKAKPHGLFDAFSALEKKNIFFSHFFTIFRPLTKAVRLATPYI
jgi:hypothetical protein